MEEKLLREKWVVAPSSVDLRKLLVEDANARESLKIPTSVLIRPLTMDLSLRYKAHAWHRVVEQGEMPDPLFDYVTSDRGGDYIHKQTCSTFTIVSWLSINLIQDGWVRVYHERAYHPKDSHMFAVFVPTEYIAHFHGYRISSYNQQVKDNSYSRIWISTEFSENGSINK